MSWIRRGDNSKLKTEFGGDSRAFLIHWIVVHTIQTMLPYTLLVTQKSTRLISNQPTLNYFITVLQQFLYTELLYCLCIENSQDMWEIVFWSDDNVISLWFHNNRFDWDIITTALVTLKIRSHTKTWVKQLEHWLLPTCCPRHLSGEIETEVEELPLKKKCHKRIWNS